MDRQDGLCVHPHPRHLGRARSDAKNISYKRMLKGIVGRPSFSQSPEGGQIQMDQAIIYIMLLSDLEKLLSVWENVLSIANVT